MASKLSIDPRRIRTSARFLLRSLSLRHTSFLLALLAVTVAATLTAALLGMRADLRLKMSRELKGFGPNVLITPADGTIPMSLDQSRVAALREVLRREGFASEVEISGMLLAASRIRVADAQGGWEDATLVGAEFSSLSRLNPSWKLDGTWPEERSDGCVVGVSLASRLGLTLRATAEFSTSSATRRCEVSGLLSTGESEDEELFLPLGEMQEALGMTGRISLAALSVGGGASEAVRAARAVQRAWPGPTARVLWQVASAQGALLSKLDRLAVSLSVTVFLLCGLCVMTTLMSIVLEREPEIGLMRSLGAGDGEILIMFLGEVTLLASLGATAGILLGMATARLVGQPLFGTPITPRLEVVPAVLSLSLGICWVSVLIPLRRALTIQPADALRGELMAFVLVDHVTRRYDRQVKALDQVSLEISAGEWLAVMGPSGSGKTTLLNLLGGLDVPNEGRIIVDGQDLSALSRPERIRYRRESVGLVFQQYHLIPYLTALENVMLAQYLHSLADEQEAARALEGVGLGDRLQHLPSQLSGGERQRVCIARALINRPKLVLADEPTGSLDEANERAVLELFQQMHRRGQTLVMVTHDPTVGRLADRQIQLEHGRVAGEFLTGDETEEDLDEVLEYLWMKLEGDDAAHEVCGRGFRLATPALLDRMRGLGILAPGPELALTAAGHARAESLIRRQRLAETLFTHTFQMQEHLVEKEACVFEHILSPAMTDSICSFLGHPQFCPHGKPIPRGACCLSADQAPVSATPVSR